MTNLKNDNKLFLFVGPSGVGKNVIIDVMLKIFPKIKKIPSFTTRPKRPIEKEGVEHFFVSIKKFKDLIKNNELLEHEEVYPGIYYGMSLQITKQLLEKYNLIKDIDILGAQNLKKQLPENIVSIFLKLPDLNALRERISKRKFMTENQIKIRLKRADFEIKKAHLTDYQVVNDDFKTCINEISKIIKTELKSKS